MPFMDALVNRLARGEVSLADGAPGDPVPLPDLVSDVRQGERDWRVEGGGVFRPARARRLLPRSPATTRSARSARTSIRASRCSPRPPTRRCGGSGTGRGSSSLDDAGDAAFTGAARGDLRGPLLWAALLLALAEMALASALAAASRDEAHAGARRVRAVARPRSTWPSGCPRRGETLRLGGLPGSSGAVLAAWLAARFPQRLLTIVAPTPGDAERWLTDLAHLTDEGVALYPQREALGEDEPHYEIAGERAETIEALLQGRLRVLVTTARATAERTLMPAALERLRLRLATGERRPPGDVARALERMGYRRVPTVTEVAEFSVRGGILDVYGFGMAAPARLEWWGDDVSSIRGFDLTTQRSLQELTEITVLPISTRACGSDGSGRHRRSGRPGPAAHAAARCSSCSRPTPSSSRRPPGPIRTRCSAPGTRREHHLEVARRLGEDVPGREDILEPPEHWTRAARGVSPAAASRRAGGPAVRLLPAGEDRPGPQPPARPARAARRRRSSCATTRASSSGSRSCSRRAAAAHVRATLAIGALDGGFVMPTLRVLTDHEIFRRARRLRRPRRYRQAAPSAATGALAEGDYVVHLDHGIGIYRGIDTITAGESTLEVAIVEYEGGDRLNVPLYRLDQLERYRAAGEDGDRPPPRLHRLGGSRWAAGAREDPPGHQADGGGAARPVRPAHGERRLSPSRPTPAGSGSSSRAFSTRTRPTSGRPPRRSRRDMERPRPDGPAAGGRRRLRQDRDRGAGGVQGGAGRQAGRGAGADDDSRRAARADLHRAAGGLSRSRVEVLSRFRTAKEQKAALERLAAGADRHRHRHPPTALEGRRCSRISGCSSWTRSTASA